MPNIARQPQKLTVDTFLAFYETRPDEEQWQLIDGTAVLMTPPFVTHQRIASNLERLLNDALEAHAPHLLASQRIGIEIAQFPHYRPEPDVVVLDLEVPAGRRYVERFYLAAEILSDSDDERINLKREFYRAHKHNRAILLVSQDRHELAVDVRHDGSWVTQVLSGPDVALELPDFGLTCRLRDIYKNTPIVGRCRHLAIPDFQTLMLPVLRASADGEVRVADVVEQLAVQFSLTTDERCELLPSGLAPSLQD